MFLLFMNEIKHLEISIGLCVPLLVILLNLTSALTGLVLPARIKELSKEYSK